MILAIRPPFGSKIEIPCPESVDSESEEEEIPAKSSKRRNGPKARGVKRD